MSAEAAGKSACATSLWVYWLGLPRADDNARFNAALDVLVEQIKGDRTVLAAILCGSLSHDAVWEKSDIDLALITSDDKKPDKADVALYADGVNVHAFLMPR